MLFRSVIGIIAVLRQFKRHDLFLQMAKTLIEQYPKKKLVFLIIILMNYRKFIHGIIINY